MKKLPKILFRTSGGTAYGKELDMGHVYRSINLASHLKKSKIFFLIEDYGSVKQIISQRNFKQVFTLKKDISLKDDLIETTQFIKKHDIDILIIDKYNLKLEFTKIVKTLVISDLRRIDFPASLVFNGFIGFKNSSIANRYGTRCFVGPNYQVLDSRFSKEKKLKKKYDLLVTFGGFDEKNVSDLIETHDNKYTRIRNVKNLNFSSLKFLEKYVIFIYIE